MPPWGRAVLPPGGRAVVRVSAARCLLSPRSGGPGTAGEKLALDVHDAVPVYEYPVAFRDA